MNAGPVAPGAQKTRQIVRCDLLVAGSGAAGLAAALTARKAGLEVLLVEKTAFFGGTSAVSGGGVWVPGNRFSRDRGQNDTAEAALTYLQSLCGNRLNTAMAKAYLKHCVAAMEAMEAMSDLRFGPNPIPDYQAELPGGLAGGRSMRAARYDGRALGKRLAQLRKPLASTVIFRGMMVSAEDLPDLFRAGRSLRSALRVAHMLQRHAFDWLRNGQVTRLANGNGLTGALLQACEEAGVLMQSETRLRELCSSAGRVTGAVLQQGDSVTEVEARRGVVLAGGGAPHGAWAGAYPHVRAGLAHHSLAPEGNQGDLIFAAQTVGAVIRRDLAEPAALTPVSLVPTNGGVCGFPHFFDRSKPGFIAVSQAGRRFGNECDEYHLFARALIDAAVRDGRIWLICDHQALRRYGVGPVPPFPGRLSPWLRNGYLRRAASLAALARAIGAPADVLAASIGSYNRDVSRNSDPEFGRGRTIYNRFIGDAGQNNAPLASGPWYAVELKPGDLGSFCGLATDGLGRVQDQAGQAIQGLYAAGNDAASFMGGHYPAAGITLGPALTFGWLAARHAAGLTPEA